MPENLKIRRRSQRMLRGGEVVAGGLLGDARFGKMPRHQLRLVAHDVRKLLFKHLGHKFVVLLPLALEQRLMQRLLYQGVLEDVFRSAEKTAAIEQSRGN